MEEITNSSEVTDPSLVVMRTLLPSGSVVRLISGGPLMTVISIDSPLYRKCIWFTMTEDLECLGGLVNFYSFPVIALMEVTLATPKLPDTL